MSEPPKKKVKQTKLCFKLSSKCVKSTINGKMLVHNWVTGVWVASSIIPSSARLDNIGSKCLFTNAFY